MELEMHQKNLCLLNYPGYYTSEESMLQSLNGLQSVAETLAEPSARMTVSFDPDNKFAKPLFGDRKLVDNSLVLKVKVRRRKNAPSSEAELVGCEVVGIGSIAYEFCNLADFQYLPVEKNSVGEVVDMQKLILGFDEADPIHPITNLLSLDLPVVIRSSVVSRFDRPVSYYFRPETC